MWIVRPRKTYALLGFGQGALGMLPALSCAHRTLHKGSPERDSDGHRSRSPQVARGDGECDGKQTCIPPWLGSQPGGRPVCALLTITVGTPLGIWETSHTPLHHCSTSLSITSLQLPFPFCKRRKPQVRDSLEFGVHVAKSLPMIPAWPHPRWAAPPSLHPTEHHPSPQLQPGDLQNWPAAE